MKQITSTFDNYFKEYKINKSDSEPTIIINENITYQTHIGFGGAFTDSACFIFNQLDEKQKQEVLNAYFSKSGLNYNMGRLTIGSCDFSRFEYDYITDYNGDDFSLRHDKDNILNFVKRAHNTNKLILIASSWSAPKIYKTNNEKCHGGKLKNDCYSLYAKYIVNYVKHMKKEKIDISYLTIQNEPEAKQTWESCLFTPQEEFALAKCIYDEINKNELDVKLLLWDHNRDVIVNRVIGYYKDGMAEEIVYGFAYHWYDNYNHSNLTIVHDMHPNKHLFFTEGCIELLSLNKDDPQSAVGTMKNALRYARNYIMDSLNYCEAFVDWNLLLDEKGGPNHVGNYCEALIMFDSNNNKLMYNPSYYVVKHFAHFIMPNAKRIEVINKSNLLVTAYINPNGKIIVVLSNESKETTVTLKIKGQNIMINLPENSLTTIKE